MKTLMKRLALSTACIAFNNGAGWKMDGENFVKDGDGNPIFIDSSGAERSIKGDTVPNLNAEAQRHRQRAETAEANLAKYVGADGKPLDPEKARSAIELTAKIDQSKLIDTGKLDELRTQIEGQYKPLLSEKDAAIAERDGKISNMLIDGVFSGSAFVNEHVAMPREFFEAALRTNFKVEDGKVTAYDKAGNRIMSKRSLGEYADAEEALQLIVETHPQRDVILKAPAGGGTGNGGNGGNGGGGAAKRIRRADFEALTGPDQAATAAAARKGEIAIVD